jgi:DNA-binding NarL/FixJ family response regulator
MDIKIVIADDHRLIAEGIQNMIRYSSEMEIIGIYPNGTALLEALKTVQPDILLLDICMPWQQGDEIAAIVRKTYPDIKILVLTSFDSIFFIRDMVEKNVHGYILKDIGQQELSNAIQTLYDGGTYFDNRVIQQMQRDTKIRERQKETGSALTKREQEVLNLIAENYTNVEIGEKLFLSRRTIEHIRESLFSKMAVKKTSDLIKELNAIRRFDLFNNP